MTPPTTPTTPTLRWEHRDGVLRQVWTMAPVPAGRGLPPTPATAQARVAAQAAGRPVWARLALLATAGLRM